jgi:hypothetical protein
MNISAKLINHFKIFSRNEFKSKKLHKNYSKNFPEQNNFLLSETIQRKNNNPIKQWKISTHEVELPILCDKNISKKNKSYIQIIQKKNSAKTPKEINDFYIFYHPWLNKTEQPKIKTFKKVSNNDIEKNKLINTNHSIINDNVNIRHLFHNKMIRMLKFGKKDNNNGLIVTNDNINLSGKIINNKYNIKDDKSCIENKTNNNNFFKNNKSVSTNINYKTIRKIRIPKELKKNCEEVDNNFEIISSRFFFKKFCKQ